MATVFESETDALKTAKEQGYDYLIFPRTNFWVDPTYMFCGASSDGSRGFKLYDTPFNEPWHDSDEADVDILLFDVKMGKLVSNYNVRSVGCPVVFLGLLPVGRTTPEGRLKSVLVDWENAQIKQIPAEE